jgi:hypothetical protein
MGIEKIMFLLLKCENCLEKNESHHEQAGGILLRVGVLGSFP